MALLPPRATLEVGAVLEFGARKYAPDNWRKVENPRLRYLGAALRHVFAFMSGESIDADSGRHHLGCAICSLMFVLELELDGGKNDPEA